MDTNTTRQKEAIRRTAATTKLHTALAAAGHTIKDDGFVTGCADDVYIHVHVSYQAGPGGWGSNGRLMAQVIGGGDQTYSCPEGKKGLNHAKIIAQVEQRIAYSIAERERAAKKESAAAAFADKLDRVHAALGVDAPKYSTPSIGVSRSREWSGMGMVVSDLTEEEAIAALRLIQAMRATPSGYDQEPEA